jgi:hypothetical protein
VSFDTPRAPQDGHRTHLSGAERLPSAAAATRTPLGPTAAPWALRGPLSCDRGAGAGVRTLTPFRAAEFKSAAYTDSATPAWPLGYRAATHRWAAVELPRAWHGAARVISRGKMEATSGFGPLNRGFADPPLNHLGTSPRMLAALRGRFGRQGNRRFGQTGCPSRIRTSPNGSKVRCPTTRRRGRGSILGAIPFGTDKRKGVERKTGLEPATLTLAR